jgi:hypothetical protein
MMAQFFRVFSHPFEQGSGTPAGGIRSAGPTANPQLPDSPGAFVDSCTTYSSPAILAARTPSRSAEKLMTKASTYIGIPMARRR